MLSDERSSASFENDNSTQSPTRRDTTYHETGDVSQQSTRTADSQSDVDRHMTTEMTVDYSSGMHIRRALDTPHEIGALNPESDSQGEEGYLVDAPFYFDNDLNMETIEQLLESLAGYDELGRVEIDRWPRNDEQTLVSSIVALTFSWLREELVNECSAGVPSKCSY
jgi:hypothetical protein